MKRSHAIAVGLSALTAGLAAMHGQKSERRSNDSRAAELDSEQGVDKRAVGSSAASWPQQTSADRENPSNQAKNMVASRSPALQPGSTQASAQPPRARADSSGVAVIGGALSVVGEPASATPIGNADEGASPQLDDASPIAPPKLTRSRSRIEGAWQNEPHDAVHTREMQSYLAQSAEAANLDPKVVQETDCGASTCRVVLSFDKPEDAASFQELAQNPEFQYELKALPPSNASNPQPDPNARQKIELEVLLTQGEPDQKQAERDRPDDAQPEAAP